MVTLSLFDTLLALHCEDLMLELLLKFLIPCKHIPISHRHKVNKVDSYCTAVEHFLELTPEVMKQACDSVAQREIQPISKTIGANWNHYGMHSGDSLYSNYRAYLFDARHKITQCKQACTQWTSSYRLQNQGTNKRNEKTLELIRDFLNEFSTDNGIVGGVNEKSSLSTSKQPDSLQSLGESSGYESFKYRNDDEFTAADDQTIDATGEGSSDDSAGNRQKLFESWKLSNRRQDIELEFDYSEDLFTQGTVSLGL